MTKDEIQIRLKNYYLEGSVQETILGESLAIREVQFGTQLCHSVLSHAGTRNKNWGKEKCMDQSNSKEKSGLEWLRLG